MKNSITKAEMEALAQKQLVAYNSKNIEEFMSCYHAEVVVSELLDPKQIACGHEEVRNIFEKLFQSTPDLHCELKSRIVLDSVVIDEEWVTGSKKFPGGHHVVAIYAFRDGKIDRVWFPG